MTMKATQTGTVEIKKCGFSERPKLLAPGPEGSESGGYVDVLAELFKPFEGKVVRVTVEQVRRP